MFLKIHSLLIDMQEKIGGGVTLQVAAFDGYIEFTASWPIGFQLSYRVSSLLLDNARIDDEYIIDLVVSKFKDYRTYFTKGIIEK